MKQNLLRAPVSAQLDFNIMAKTAKYKNNQPNKETIKFHAVKMQVQNIMPQLNLKKKIGSSYYIKLIVIVFGIEMKNNYILGEK